MQQFSGYQWFYSLWKVLKSQKVAITHFAIEIDSQVDHYVVAMENFAEQYILTKCSKCNIFQVIIASYKCSNGKSSRTAYFNKML